MAMALPNTHRSENTIRRSSVPPSDATRAAALIEREEMLADEIRFVGEASYRRRQEIELELSDIRRGLELMGFRRKAGERAGNFRATLREDTRSAFEDVRVARGALVVAAARSTRRIR
jgi:hypothetical protein